MAKPKRIDFNKEKKFVLELMRVWPGMFMDYRYYIENFDILDPDVIKVFEADPDFFMKELRKTPEDNIIEKIKKNKDFKKLILLAATSSIKNLAIYTEYYPFWLHSIDFSDVPDGNELLKERFKKLFNRSLGYGDVLGYIFMYDIKRDESFIFNGLKDTEILLDLYKQLPVGKQNSFVRELADFYMRLENNIEYINKRYTELVSKSDRNYWYNDFYCSGIYVGGNRKIVFSNVNSDKYNTRYNLNVSKTILANMVKYKDTKTGKLITDEKFIFDDKIYTNKAFHSDQIEGREVKDGILQFIDINEMKDTFREKLKSIDISDTDIDMTLFTVEFKD